MPIKLQIIPTLKHKDEAALYLSAYNKLPAGNKNYLAQKGPLTKATMMFEVGPRNVTKTNTPLHKHFYGLDSVDQAGHFHADRLRKEGYLDNKVDYTKNLGFKPAVDATSAITLKLLNDFIPNRLSLQRNKTHPSDYRWINQAYYTFGNNAFSDTIKGYSLLNDGAKVKELERAVKSKYNNNGTYGTSKVNGLYVRQALAELFNK